MPMPTLTPEQVKDTRLKLTQVALDLYRQSDKSSVTLRAVANQLGVSHTHSYRYFANKSDLLVAMRNNCFSDLSRAVLERLDSNDCAEQQLKTLIEQHFRYALENPKDYALIFAVSMSDIPGDEELAAQSEAHLVSTIAVVDAFMKSQNITGEPAVLCHVAWTSFHGLLSLHFAGHLEPGYTLEVLAPELVRRLFGIDITI